MTSRPTRQPVLHTALSRCGRDVSVSLVTAMLCVAAQAQSTDTIKIGVLTDFSGPYASWGAKGSVLAAEMAAEDFKKAQPTFASKVEVVSADFQLKPDLGLGTLLGPVVGAVFLISMEGYLAALGSWVTVIQGVVFILCVLALRRGIVGTIESYFVRFTQPAKITASEQPPAIPVKSVPA